MCAEGGLLINVCRMDREFQAVQDYLSLIDIYTTVAREDVPEIESGIRQTKEQMRAYKSDLGHKYIPTLLLTHTV